jgi:O-antigen ligase
MIIVSLKYLLVRIWFISTFYFVATQLFQKKAYLYKYIWLYTAALTIVVFYTIIRHSSYGLFYQKAANFVCSPFYNDHTSYGAALAFVLPPLIGFLFIKRYSLFQKTITTLILLIITTGLLFSYTRAAWLSLAIVFFIYILILLKIKFRNILISSIILIALLLSFKTQILISLESNKQDSSSNLTEQIKSITNIASDASNLERLNRWSSALKMFKEKPFLGFGPGTYMFQYAPYQMSYEKTIISTNYGDGGNAHSEYIGALVESGILGSLTFIIILITTLYTALNLYSKLDDKELKILILSVTLGLISYYLHGFLNNFLDTDKISVLFWGYTAMIVSIDVKNNLLLKK